MELAQIMTIVTILVTWILGELSKKYQWVEAHKIPMQNLLIGLIIALVEFAITKNFSTAIALSGLLAGGVYDLFGNLKELFEQDK